SSPTASWPRATSAFRTPRPVLSDTSASELRPPMSTPILVISDHLDLHLEIDAVAPAHGVAANVDEREHVGGAGAAGVDDPVRVLGRHPGGARAPALEPAVLDEPAGELAGRVLEDGAGVGHRLGLALGAAVAERAHVGLDIGARP